MYAILILICKKRKKKKEKKCGKGLTFAIVRSFFLEFGEVVHLSLSKTSGGIFLDLFVDIQETMQSQLQMQGTKEDNQGEILHLYRDPGTFAVSKERDDMKC